MELLWFVSLWVKLQLSVITSVNAARGFVHSDLLISNYIFLKNEKAQTVGCTCLQKVSFCFVLFLLHWEELSRSRQRLLRFTAVNNTTWLWFSAQMLGSSSAPLHMVPLTLQGRKINGLFFYCGLAHYVLTKPAFED